MRYHGRILPMAVLLAVAGLSVSSAADRVPVRALKVTVLSTMLADGDELGEWGFAALVECDGRKILFDTGAKTDVVLKNAQDKTKVREQLRLPAHAAQ